MKWLTGRWASVNQRWDGMTAAAVSAEIATSMSSVSAQYFTSRCWSTWAACSCSCSSYPSPPFASFSTERSCKNQALQKLWRLPHSVTWAPPNPYARLESTTWPLVPILRQESSWTAHLVHFTQSLNSVSYLKKLKLTVTQLLSSSVLQKVHSRSILLTANTTDSLRLLRT